jgi:hypothetical protein
MQDVTQKNIKKRGLSRGGSMGRQVAIKEKIRLFEAQRNVAFHRND